MPDFFTMEGLIALVTLTALEIVLGIDNIIFIVVVTSRLPRTLQAQARNVGLALAMLARIVLLFGISFILQLTAPLFSLMGHEVSGRDLVLLVGGLFLLAKATHEIHEKIEDAQCAHTDEEDTPSATTYLSAILQILALDMVFSLDSVITAVGMVQEIWIMVAAIVIAVGVMLVFSSAISRFVTAHPTVQMLAFSFLLLVAVFLIAEGLGKHIDRGYIYFAMAFSLFVEMLNLRLRPKRPRLSPNVLIKNGAQK